MASEQFSLCWDNFHKNMSSGMNSLLENEDLVDVTLAVEGKCLKAHKMVLSVCSPYFKELFKSNPCQHPIVFMKDVSYVAISDLLQFMYQGEVQVSQENLTTFIKTAEALQIKGLTGDGNGSADDAESVSDSRQSAPVEEYRPVPKPKKQPPPPVVTTTPAPKRPRLEAQSAPAIQTKQEPASSSDPPIQFKMEPYDNTASGSIHDDAGDDNFGDDTLDDNTVDDTEDYSMMEGGEEGEPQAGTSTDGAGEGQGNKAVMEEFFKLHAKLDHILRYCKDTKYDMFVTTKDSQPNDCDAIVGNHQLFKFPIQCVAELNEFNEKLRDEEYFKLHVEKLRQYYEKSNLSGKAVAYSLIEQLIERPVLTNYTWTGASKYSTNKLRFTDVQNFIKLFFVVINGVDANFTLLDNEDFFKNRVLKYSEIRARDRGTPRRRSAPKAGGPKRKTLIKMLQSSQASSLNYGDLLRPTGDSNIDNLIHDNQQTENN